MMTRRVILPTEMHVTKIDRLSKVVTLQRWPDGATLELPILGDPPDDWMLNEAVEISVRPPAKEGEA